MKILLLPGMDGTGILFKPFLESAPRKYEVETVTLIQRSGVDFAEQASQIIETIQTPVAIVAESYSGLVALEILKRIPSKIIKVFFVASFLERPSVISRYSDLIPEKFLQLAVSDNWLAMRFLFSKWNSEELSELFLLAMQNVSPSVLKFRLEQIANLKTADQRIDKPCVYLQASKDNLVSHKAINSFKKVFNEVKVESIDGTHFLLQTNPKKCWEAIQRYGHLGESIEE